MGSRAEVPYSSDLWVGKKCISIAFQNLDSVLYIILEIRICHFITLSLKKTLARPRPQHLFLWKNVWICVGSFSLKEGLLNILSLRSQTHVRSPLNPAASWFFCFTPLILECWVSSLTLIGTFKEKSKKKEKKKRPPLIAKVRDPKVKVLKNYSEILNKWWSAYFRNNHC